LVVTRDGPKGLERLHDNHSVERIVGRSAEELRSMPVMTILPPEERARLGAMRAAVQAGKPAPALIDTIVVRPDGTRVPIELGVSTRKDGDDTIAFVFMRDVTMRRQLQARLLEADRLATVGALCAGVAHEINNPLTSVLLHLTGLRRSLERLVPDPASRGYVSGVLDVVLEGAERVSRSVKELMVFADPAIYRRGPVDLRTVVERAVRAATPIVELKARLEVATVEVPEIDGDPARLGQAVLNLLIDAAQAFDHSDRERNVVAVSLRAERGWVAVEVADNGRPLEPACGDAFEPFFPVRGGTSTGIGLAVTRTIVSSLGGTAALEPREGGGAVATIRLPQR
jgi:two-component system, NtrC family, sensor kinase